MGAWSVRVVDRIPDKIQVPLFVLGFLVGGYGLWWYVTYTPPQPPMEPFTETEPFLAWYVFNFGLGCCAFALAVSNHSAVNVTPLLEFSDGQRRGLVLSAFTLVLPLVTAPLAFSVLGLVHVLSLPFALGGVLGVVTTILWRGAELIRLANSVDPTE